MSSCFVFCRTLSLSFPLSCTCFRVCVARVKDKTCFAFFSRKKMAERTIQVDNDTSQTLIIGFADYKKPLSNRFLSLFGFEPKERNLEIKGTRYQPKACDQGTDCSNLEPWQPAEVQPFAKVTRYAPPKDNHTYLVVTFPFNEATQQQVRMEHQMDGNNWFIISADGILSKQIKGAEPKFAAKQSAIATKCRKEAAELVGTGKPTSAECQDYRKRLGGSGRKGSAIHATPKTVTGQRQAKKKHGATASSF